MRKTGFTLIELLAVIVILAIIALIATPLILKVVDEARKGAFKNSAYGIVEAAELSFAREIIKGSISEVTYTYRDGVETSEPVGKALNYKGEKPQSGSIKINSYGKVAIALYKNGYCAEKDFGDTEVRISGKLSNECVLDILTTDTSGVASPEISDGMIPIRWNGTTWIKADVENKVGEYYWYDYNKQEWANIVLVTENSRSSYVNATIGTEINETDIIAYFVWIPRYRYQLFNVEAQIIPNQKVNIQFENKATSKSLGNSNGEWLTHPAFTFGTDEINGFWIGKFETTGNLTNPTIKPSLTSFRSQTPKNQFTAAQKFNTTTTYGLTTVNDAHMTKSSEWGAIAYLSQSDYGKYGNPIYTDEVGLEREIYNNNNSNYITGCAGDNLNDSAVTKCNEYDTNQGVKASTTGNIYGIYDMNGGAWEYVMGVMYNSDNKTLMVGNSGFNQEIIDDPTMSKYIDKYSYGETWGDQAAFNRRILGDAIGEVRNWNDDLAYMVNYNGSWVRRSSGYNNGASSGIFAVHYGNGAWNSVTSFRITAIGG